MRKLVRHLAVAVGLAGCAVAARWAVQVARADLSYNNENLAGTEEAIRIAPGSAPYYSRLAFFLSETQPTRAAEALKRAIALNPHDSRPKIELALLAEVDAKYSTAESLLLEAAASDKLYAPAWTLANYYFRRNNTEQFWKWAKAAAAKMYGDPAPLFRLCGIVQEDGRLLDRLAISDPKVESAYLMYLVSQGRVDLILPSALRLIRRQQREDAPALLRACDSLIEAGRADDALNLWNALAKARMISQPELDPGAEALLPNDQFEPQPTSQGFDWRLRPVEGVSASELEEGGLRLSFSGRQPEECEPLYRTLPLRDNANYLLTWRHSTSGVATEAGLMWRVVDSVSGATLLETPIPGVENGRDFKAEFSTPQGCRTIRIGVICRRVLGRTRIEGSLLLTKIQLKRTPAATLTKGLRSSTASVN